MKQTHDIKLAESFSPITKKFEESTRKITKVINASHSVIEINQDVVPVEIDSEGENNQNNPRAFPNCNKYSSLMTENLGALMNSKKSLKKYRMILAKRQP